MSRRCVYLALRVPNGLIVGCESVFVAYSPQHVGTLFACTAAGTVRTEDRGYAGTSSTRSKIGAS